jgi:DNA-directed RNA polymerase subunit K
MGVNFTGCRDNFKKNLLLVKLNFMEVIFMELENLTRFERARLLGARAIQISMGAKPKVELGDSLDPIDIAYKELKEGVLPLDIIRDD